MTPVEIAAHLCRERGASFREEVEAFMLDGYVFSTPNAFALARPVPRGAEIIEAAQSWPAAECDAWFIWAGVGDVHSLLGLMPFSLPWIGWVRQGRDWRRVHWLKTERFKSALAKRTKIK